MKKYQLLLLDANIIIHLHELDIWDRFLDHCDVTVARSVFDESKYYERDNEKIAIDLESEEIAKRIKVIEVNLSRFIEFRNLFSNNYLDRLDEGEAESLAYLYYSEEDYLICSADSIVFKVLAHLDRTESGISLEEILNKIGQSRTLCSQYTRHLREHWTREGQQEAIRGVGFKNNK